MPFSRYEDQCLKCACYIKNIEGEVRRIMDDWNMKCTNDRYCHQENPCDAFIKKWKFGGTDAVVAKGMQSSRPVNDQQL